MAVIWVASLLLLSSCTLVLCQLPIPARYDGFTFRRRGRDPVVVEAFIDPVCSDSKAAWPGLKAVLPKYGRNLKFILHPFPLPYHRNSFLSSRALHIASSLNASLVYPLLELLFEHQDHFSSNMTAAETPLSVSQRLVTLFASTLAPTQSKAIQDGFQDPVTDAAARSSFKYACSRGVTGTPRFLVNGVSLGDSDEIWGADQWSQVLDPLLKPEAAKNSVHKNDNKERRT